METIKTTDNLEFDVIYADGTRKRVREGVLFEVENDTIIFHNGTDRPEVIVATAEAVAELMEEVGFPAHIVALVCESYFRIIDKELEREEKSEK